MITSFKATLEETYQSDLLLHVADASQAAVFEQIDAVNEVLTELAIDEKNTLLVINKIDAVEDAAVIDSLLNRFPNAIAVSAKTKMGFDSLAVAVSAALSRAFKPVEVETAVSNGKLVAFLSEHGDVQETEYFEDRVVVKCRLPEKAYGRVKEMPGVKMRDQIIPLPPSAPPKENTNAATTTTQTNEDSPPQRNSG